MNTLLERYLIGGESVRDIALRTAAAEDHVRAVLASHGLRVPSDEIRDPVCAAVAWRGYISFGEFVRRHGLEPLAEQAELLGVATSSLEKMHEFFRQLAKGSG